MGMMMKYGAIHTAKVEEFSRNRISAKGIHPLFFKTDSSDRLSVKT